MSGPARSSLDTLRALADGSGHTSAAASVFGLRLGDVAVGRVGAQGTARPRCGSGLGSALTLADLALGAAISSTVPEAGVQTLRLQASTATPLTPVSGILQGEARSGTATRGSATSSGEVRTDDGRALITMSCRCAVRPAVTPGSDPDLSEIVRSALPTGDPWLELGLCTAHTADEPSLPAEPALSNLSGVVQGGVIAGVLAHACTHVLAYPPQSTSIDLDVAYLRGVAADGSRLPITVELIHRGGQYGVARATLTDRKGRTAATATVSTWSPRP